MSCCDITRLSTSLDSFPFERNRQLRTSSYRRVFSASFDFRLTCRFWKRSRHEFSMGLPEGGGTTSATQERSQKQRASRTDSSHSPVRRSNQGRVSACATHHRRVHCWCELNSTRFV